MADMTAKATHAKLVIIGSGPAGYTAAIYAARAMLEPILIQGIQPGGQLTITTDVENYPGFADVIQGPWLMEQMQKQAEHVGTRIVTDHVNDLDLSRRPFRLETGLFALQHAWNVAETARGRGVVKRRICVLVVSGFSRTHGQQAARSWLRGGFRWHPRTRRRVDAARASAERCHVERPCRGRESAGPHETQLHVQP